jgi:hypothetical protein
MTMLQLIDGILGNFTSNSTSEEGSQNIGLYSCVASGVNPVDLAFDQNTLCSKQIGSFCNRTGKQITENRNQNRFCRFLTFQSLLPKPDTGKRPVQRHAPLCRKYKTEDNRLVFCEG